MGDSLSIIFATIVAAIIMFLFPMLDTWERQDDISYMMVYAATVEFVDSARNLGYITYDMYESFLKSIYATGNRYEITLEHRKFQYVPDFENDVYINTYTNAIINKLKTKERS